jgi:hypothetical protein
MKLKLLVCVALHLTLTATSAIAVDCYVRTDGSDISEICSGMGDAGVSLSPDCAFRTVGHAASQAACSAPGTKIRVHGASAGSWYAERVSLNHSGTSANPIVVEGYGPTKPHIGVNVIYANFEGWTFVPGDNTWYVSYSEGNPSAAYVLTSIPYEHDRVGLINYARYNDLKAPATGFRVPDKDYYIGPGIHYDAATSRLYIRLDPTPQVTSYEQQYSNLGFTENSAPSNFQILIAYPESNSLDYSIKVAASNITIRNLIIEPAHRTVQIACPADVPAPAQFVRLESNTIWSGNDGAIKGTCASQDITIKENRVQHDIPYWVSWGDCKNGTINDPNHPEPEGPCYEEMRFTMIQPSLDLNSPAKRWTIERNYISGGHDGYGSGGGEAAGTPDDKIEIMYNVFEGIADDPFELEEPGVRRHDIYGNLILNSLNCLAVGQDTTDTSYGPFYFHSNTCVLLREPYVNRCPAPGPPCTCDSSNCQAGSPWNGGREYGHQYAFKIARPTGGAVSSGLHVYNNTIVMTDSHPEQGMGVLAQDASNAMTGSEIFNNMFIKMNQRVGQGGGNWSYHTDPSVLNFNLYWKIHNDNAALLDNDNTVTTVCTDLNVECNGLGNVDYIGTNPMISEVEGFGCFADPATCDGVDRSDATLWKIKAGSEYWTPAMFIPKTSSTACGAGRPPETLTLGFPYMPAMEGIPYDSTDVGAIPCGVSASNWNVFPFSEVWKSSALASGVPPDGLITQPTNQTICKGSSITFCASKTDPDGAPPYSYMWDIPAMQMPGCPIPPPTLCPGNITFPNEGTCSYIFRVTDRWGLTDPTPQSRTITVQTCGGGPGGGQCSDCTRCLCYQEQ